MMSDIFPSSYAESREQFLGLANKQAAWVESLPLSPDHPELMIDAAWVGPADCERVVIVTSGLHGVEACLGAAVQAGLLTPLENACENEFESVEDKPEVAQLHIHALNPFGFLHSRRSNETNVDLNRNFLLTGESFTGAPPLYGQLDSLLNPRQKLGSSVGFLWSALGQIGRHGMPAMKQTIAGGQYEFPHGIFFGGSGTEATQGILKANLPRWLANARRIVHLDIHTGLGKWGAHQLLLETIADDPRTRWWQKHFGQQSVSYLQDAKAEYVPRGSLGSWCAELLKDRWYAYACAEIGTYGPLKVLAGLRAENAAYWQHGLNSPERAQAAAHLRELFCPANFNWRTYAFRDCVFLVLRARMALQDEEI